jgi:leader peptidase (prepilin peptidase)/N-methyltransferase
MLPDIDPQVAVWLIAGWYCVFGAVIGSFLNVVAYRLPAGLSVVHPGSHCPRCQHAIRWHDNVPVLGWLWLRGRCRDCGTTIAIRYPAVEALTALVFLAVALQWLVFRSEPTSDQALATPIIAAGYFLFLLATLLVAALIDIDQWRMPVRLFLPALLVGVGLPLLAGDGLRPLSAWAGSNVWTDALAGAAAGLVAGLAIGRLRNAAAGWALITVGAFVGWQATLAVSLAMGIAVLAQRPLGRRSLLSPYAWLFLAVLITVLWLGWGQPLPHSPARVAAAGCLH